MPLISSLRGLRPEVEQLVNFFMKGKRFAQREPEMPMIPAMEVGDPLFRTRFPLPYYEGSPSYISYQDLERMNRAADLGYRIPAWRGVKGFPARDAFDPSFRGRGAHVDLTPSGHASRIWSRKYGKPFDVSPEFTGLNETDKDVGLRLMSQVAIRPSKRPVYMSDFEANDPDLIAKIHGYDPDDLYRGITQKDADEIGDFMTGDKFYKQRWNRAIELLRDNDSDILYPNIGEVDKSKRNLYSRWMRAERANDYAEIPKLESYQNFLGGKSAATWFNDPGRTTLPLSLRMEMADELLSDPRKLTLIGNPSYVVTDPSRMRDLGLAEFRDPESFSLYKAQGGVIKKQGALRMLSKY